MDGQNLFIGHLNVRKIQVWTSFKKGLGSFLRDRKSRKNKTIKLNEVSH